MPCYHPMLGYRGVHGKITMQKEGSKDGALCRIPCGQCTGCRMEQARQWAVRCVHEASMHDDNCFLTLTYDDEHIPPNGTLVKKDLQDFFKRLRRRIEPQKIRYYAVGEYGDQSFRPHYHALIFGKDLREGNCEKRRGKQSSELVAEEWTAGHNVVGNLTYESAAYVARYCLKKVLSANETDKKELFERIDENTGEIVSVEPEYAVMSRRPGIANNWIKMWHGDVYPRDEIIINGKRCKPSKYYDKIYATQDSEMIAKIKFARAVKERPQLESLSHLARREKVVKKIKRSV